MMRLPILIMSLMALLFAPAASAETFPTPEALIKALYRYDTDQGDPEAPSLYSAFFSDALNARFQADRDATPDSEVGAIDFDPVIGGNDGYARRVEPGAPVIAGDRAELNVTFDNNGPVTLFYTLVLEHGGWKVDDIASRQGDDPWSLGALFDAANR